MRINKIQNNRQSFGSVYVSTRVKGDSLLAQTVTDSPAVKKYIEKNEKLHIDTFIGFDDSDKPIKRFVIRGICCAEKPLIDVWTSRAFVDVLQIIDRIKLEDASVMQQEKLKNFEEWAKSISSEVIYKHQSY